MNGKITASHVYVHYYLYNFIYDCKAYLDSVAIMLNFFYKIGENGGEIDFNFGKFRKKLIEKEPKLDKFITKLVPWFNTVYNWRRDLIHRFSTPIGWHLLKEPSPREMDEYLERNLPVKMLMEPQPYLSANFPELNKKYGTSFRDINSFCKEWLSNACNLYDKVCNAIAEYLS